ncbi:MAG: asparagine synthase (glutamine-hydrolyzing), partial [Flavobacteriales bacterium]|nr:asparagine synthase (glutamine-hydrolyzing) [Flavobacteriales bacterium]
KEHLSEMTDAHTHHGPDASGLFYETEHNVGLGHRRLSILDLSIEANQPMTSHCDRYVIVFNGEIYNYHEIGNELQIPFKTNSDTEVVLEAFCKWGVGFVKKLNGMFAIAIYDIRTTNLYLFRDRLGIKPLYYYWNETDLIFSSELKSIKASGVRLKINRQVIPSFLHLGYIPQNQTIYQNTFKLPAGSYGVFKNKHFEIHSFWKPENCILRNTLSDYSDAKKLLKKELNLAVKNRLISDVPLGTFLSGGVDSSLITAIASKHSVKKLNTFSIGFKDAKHNESEYAEQVANHLDTNHHEFILTHEDALEELENIMSNFDQPFADSSALPTYLVAKMAKKHVSVCLSGDGGDELFMGYGSYSWANRLSNPLIWSLRKPISMALNKSPSSVHKRASWLFTGNKNGLKSHIFSQEQYLFSEKELNQILRTNESINFTSINKEDKLDRKLSARENQAFFDLKNYLKDDLLVKVDIASMQNSLEVRVPLLDHNVVSLALNIDEKFKFHKSGTQKFILKDILYDYVPEHIFNRPKRGFSIPLEKWLQKELHYLIELYLHPNILNEHEIFNVSEVINLVKRFDKGETYLYNKLWCIIMLNRFLSKI